MGSSQTRVLMLRPAPTTKTLDFSGFTAPGTQYGSPAGMVWGTAFSNPGVLGKRWEPADFPLSERPVLNFGNSCLFTLSYQSKPISYRNHWGQDPIWGVTPGPVFDCDRDYKSDQELNLKAYVLHNLRGDRKTLVVGDGNMAFCLYMWQIGLEVASPDFRSLVGDNIGYKMNSLSTVSEDQPDYKAAKWNESENPVISVRDATHLNRPSQAFVPPLSCKYLVGIGMNEPSTHLLRRVNGF